MQNKKVDEFFSTEYIISLYLDYPTRNFQNELIVRSRQWFSEKEILYFLDSLVGALAFLQAKGLSHQNLSFETIYIVSILSGDKSIKIADPFMQNKEKSMFKQFLDIVNTKEKETPGIDVYFSPEQLSMLNKKQNLTIDEFKSDVFVLGMLVLELCTLTKCSLVYDLQSFAIKGEMLQELLSKVADRYTDRIYELIKAMVSMDVKERPDFLELDEIISQSFVELTNKRIAQTWQYQDYQYCVNETKSSNKSFQILKKSSQPLIHPDIHSQISLQQNQNGSKGKTPQQRQSQKQQSSQNDISNLSAIEIPSPSLKSKKENYAGQSYIFQKEESVQQSFIDSKINSF